MIIGRHFKHIFGDDYGQNIDERQRYNSIKRYRRGSYRHYAFRPIFQIKNSDYFIADLSRHRHGRRLIYFYIGISRPSAISKYAASAA